jgi:hypothetical protein
MNPYTHIVIASRLEPLVGPEDAAEYYWGAVAPDMRYVAAMRRAETHLSAQRIIELERKYPHLRSFMQGYLVHCLADQLDLGRVFFQHLPFSALKRTLTQRHLAVLLELYYLERQTVNPTLSGTHNEALSELGLSEAVAERFRQAMEQVALPALRWDPLAMARAMGLEGDSRIEKYAAAGRRFQKSRLLKALLFLGIRVGKIDEQIVSRVAALYVRYGGGPAW